MGVLLRGHYMDFSTRVFATQCQFSFGKRNQMFVSDLSPFHRVQDPNLVNAVASHLNQIKKMSHRLT